PDGFSNCPRHLIEFIYQHVRSPKLVWRDSEESSACREFPLEFLDVGTDFPGLLHRLVGTLDVRCVRPFQRHPQEIINLNPPTTGPAGCGIQILGDLLRPVESTPEPRE